MGDRHSVPYLDKLVARMPRVVARLQPMPPCLSLTGSLPPAPPFCCCTALDCLAEDETV
ncbi:hypothetical protein ACLK17_22235 [Escherichia coli]